MGKAIPPSGCDSSGSREASGSFGGGGERALGSLESETASLCPLHTAALVWEGLRGGVGAEGGGARRVM